MVYVGVYLRGWRLRVWVGVTSGLDADVVWLGGLAGKASKVLKYAGLPIIAAPTTQLSQLAAYSVWIGAGK